MHSSGALGIPASRKKQAVLLARRSFHILLRRALLGVRYYWLLLPPIWASFLLVMLERGNMLPALEESFPGFGRFALGIFFPLLYLLWRERWRRPRGLSLSRGDWLVGLWVLALSLTCAFNIVVTDGMTRLLLGLLFLLGGWMMIYFTGSLLFGSGGLLRLPPRRHPQGHPVPDRPVKKKAPRQPSERRLRFRKHLQRWGGGALLGAGIIAVAALWATRSAAGPFVPAEFGIGSPIRVGENLVDVMERRDVPAGEYGWVSETIEGDYFKRISYNTRFEGDDFAFGPVNSLSYGFEPPGVYRSSSRTTVEKILGICRRHYGKEGYSSIYYSIKQGSLDIEYTYFSKVWKIDEMHWAAVRWREEKMEVVRDLSFAIGRSKEPVELPADTVEVGYREDGNQ